MKGGNRGAGEYGEEIAARYLVLKGYRIIERNCRAGRYEIDIIAGTEGITVFAEVKLRRTDRFGSAIESLPASKLERIKKAARIYMGRRRQTGPCGIIRFDLIAIDIEPDNDRMVLNHLKGVT